MSTPVTTTVAVGGMTCASCVRSLESGLLANSHIHSVAVNLLAGRAIVDHDSSALPIAQLISLVEDLGYGAEFLSSVSQLAAAVPEFETTTSTTLAIEGMTCASCVHALESGLQAMPLVISVAVNLLAGRAVVEHKSGLSPSSLASHVEELGYGAEVLASERVGIPTTNQVTTAGSMDTIRVEANEKRWLSHLADNFLASTTATLVRQEPFAKVHAAAPLIRYETATTLLEHAINIDDNDARSIHSTASSRSDQEPQFALDLLRKTSFTLPHLIDQDMWARLSESLSSHAGVTQIERGEASLHITFHPLVTSARDIAVTVGTLTGSDPLNLLNCNEDATTTGLSALVRNATRSREQHAAHTRIVRNRFLIGLFFAIPTFVLAMIIGMFLPTSHSARHTLETTPVFQGVSILDFSLLVLVSLCVGILGVPLARSAVMSLVKRGKPDMDALISLGVWAGYLASVVGLIINAVQDAPLEPMVLFANKDDMHAGHGRAQRIHLFFETPVFLLAFLGLGRWLEAIARGRAADAVAALVALQPDVVTQVIGGKWDGVGTVDGIVKEETVPSGNVYVGDFIKVIPGGRVPCDGVVISGSSLLDCSAITGEPVPIPARPFVRAASGALNAGPSTIILAVTNPAHSSTLARIATLVDSAQASSAGAKSDAELLADRVSGAFVPLVLILSALTFVVWEVLLAVEVFPVPNGFTAHTLALQYAVAVLVVACPCAVGLAVPTAVMVGAGVAAKHGVLVKDAGRVLERCAKMSYLVADKTGTLTMGKPTVVDDRYEPSAHESTSMDLLTFRAHVWAAVKSIENNSAHPLARAMMHHAQQYLAEFDPSNDISSAVSVHQVRETPGKGLSATVRVAGLTGEWQLWLGSPAYLSTIPTVLLPPLEDVAGTIVGCAIQTTPSSSPRLASLHILDDPIRPEARAPCAPCNSRTASSSSCARATIPPCPPRRPLARHSTHCRAKYAR
ncbi:E1-E2 ATPase-domain-containing protein [Catenaria anguillulae PL171]|uniref:E1-E2 ATPase-domain-containing protein n=1 Tax=Catenaria anguillulae PL171 TaxID=765915 RepID=A0A1Y2I3T1_9FUNG|nr:E1-E2 ATPase-domain-containing protein [Catenaria anguillulae PL171]